MLDLGREIHRGRNLAKARMSIEERRKLLDSRNLRG